MYVESSCCFRFKSRMDDARLLYWVISLSTNIIIGIFHMCAFQLTLLHNCHIAVGKSKFVRDFKKREKEGGRERERERERAFVVPLSAYK